jgi:hypothetical protein
MDLGLFHATASKSTFASLCEPLRPGIRPKTPTQKTPKFINPQTIKVQHVPSPIPPNPTKSQYKGFPHQPPQLGARHNHTANLSLRKRIPEKGDG